MKTQRIILFAVVLTLLAMLVSCGGPDQVAPNFFDLDEEATFVNVSEFDGEVLDINTNRGLIALATTELDSNGNFTHKIKVYDATDNNRVVYEYAETYTADNGAAFASVDLTNYPVIKLTKQATFENDDSGKPIYENRYDYVLIQNEATGLVFESSVKHDNLSIERVNNVYVIEANDSLYWVNRNLEIMRSFPLDITDSYPAGYYASYFNIKAEWHNFLYTWEFDPSTASNVVLVYNGQGVCTAKYTFTPGTAGMDGNSSSIINPSVFVLNNGDVLIQECIVVKDEGAEYDFEFGVLEPTKLDLVTKVLNHETGEVSEIACNYLIKDLESAYARLDTNNFPFTLDKGYSNQAIIVDIENGKIGREAKYVVLSDALEISYTLPNSYLAISDSYDSIEDPDDEGYVARAYVDGVYVTCKFGWDGTVLQKRAMNYLGNTDTHYYTRSGIYTMAGELVFDIEGSEFRNLDEISVFAVGNNFYLRKYNWETQANEVWSLNLEDGTTTLVVDGVHQKIEIYTSDYLVVTDEMKETASVYNSNNELVLVFAEDDIIDRKITKNIIIAATKVDGKTTTYVLGPAVTEETTN